jgi:malate synthase
MEDAATAEISRAQVWQWVRHAAKLDDGRVIDLALVDRLLAEERVRAVARAGQNAHRYDDAAALFRRLVAARDFVDFLTLPAYEMVD